MRKRLLTVLPVYLLLFGFFALHRLDQQQSISANVAIAEQRASESENSEPTSSDKAFKQGKPTHITIPSLDIDLNITQGTYDPATTLWTLSPNNAHFADNTKLANNKEGLTLIYGHNVPAVFGKTINIQPNAIVEVKTDNNLVFSYRYTSDIIVEPTDTTVFDYDKSKHQLVLLTCIGTWSESRRIMNFELVGVSENET